MKRCVYCGRQPEHLLRPCQDPRGHSFPLSKSEQEAIRSGNVNFFPHWRW